MLKTNTRRELLFAHSNHLTKWTMINTTAELFKAEINLWSTPPSSSPDSCLKQILWVTSWPNFKCQPASSNDLYNWVIEKKNRNKNRNDRYEGLGDGPSLE
jgi:hypothetical protein